MSFSDFLLNEQRDDFGKKIATILTALQDVSEDAPHMGRRHLARLVTNVVNQIRTVLHGRWDYSQRDHLVELQKVGVALMKSIDDGSDMASVITSAIHDLEKMSGKIGTPINNIETNDQEGLEQR